MSLRVDNKTLDLFLSRRSELVNYANGIVGCRVHAEDLVQEAFVKFGEASNKNALDEPIAYLFRIVRNLAIDWTRRRDREGRIFSTGAGSDVATEDDSSPEAIALYRDEVRILNAALNDLPERTRTAVMMHRVEGYKLKEIAAALGISVSLAHALVYEGLDHCRRRLRRSG